MFVFKYAEHNGSVYNGQFQGQEVKNIKFIRGSGAWVLAHFGLRSQGLTNLSFWPVVSFVKTQQILIKFGI